MFKLTYFKSLALYNLPVGFIQIKHYDDTQATTIWNLFKDFQIIEIFMHSVLLFLFEAENEPISWDDLHSIPQNFFLDIEHSDL